MRQRIQQACERSGRDPASVLLVGVTKGVEPDQVREAVQCGLIDLGENRVQEAQSKQQALGAIGARWHLIGHLQRNKARLAVELFQTVHSVDDAELINTLARHAESQRKPLDLFVQVNVSGESTKFGCRPDDALELARLVMARPPLVLRGLMTIAPFADDPEQARPHFRRLRELRDQLHVRLFSSSLVTGHSSLLLSMGMSHDFEVAIEEGADFVRIGTAIFGARRQETGDRRPET